MNVIFYSFIFIGLALIVFGVTSIISGEKFKKKSEEEFTNWKNELVSELGKPCLEINPCIINTLSTLLVFDHKKKIALNGNLYDYIDILDFSVNNQMSYRTSTSTGSMVGRGIVGGVLLGGVGALAGASTASKTTTSEVISYTITINIRNMQHPIETFVTSDLSMANQVSGVLKIIIDSNQNLEH